MPVACPTGSVPSQKFEPKAKNFWLALSVAQETKKNPEHEKYSEFYTKMVRQK